MTSKNYYLVDVTSLYKQAMKSKTPLVDVLSTFLFSVQEHCTGFLLPGNWSRYRIKETLFKFEEPDLVKLGQLADEFNRNRQSTQECFATELGKQAYFRKTKIGDTERVFLVYPKIEIKKRREPPKRSS